MRLVIPKDYGSLFNTTTDHRKFKNPYLVLKKNVIQCCKDSKTVLKIKIKFICMNHITHEPFQLMDFIVKTSMTTFSLT